MKACIRMRPMVKREMQSSQLTPVLEVSQDRRVIEVLKGEEIMIDQSVSAYSEKMSSIEMYEELKIEQTIWRSVEQGTNLSFVSVGHTGSGKTYTLYGNKEKAPGIVPLSLESIFAYMYHRVENEFVLKVSYLDIFNETLIDLLSSSTKTGSVDEKISEEVCMNVDQIISLIRMGDINRQIGTTRTNERVSKSHTILQIKIESSFFRSDSNYIPICTINFVELSGAEWLQINEDQDKFQKHDHLQNHSIKSLLQIEKFITLRSDPKVNKQENLYNQSKLTRFMRPYLEDNSRFLWIFNISPTDHHYRVNQRVIQMAMQASKIIQNYQANIIPLESTGLFTIRKKIASLKLQLSQLEVQIQRKQQLLLNSSKGGTSPKSTYSGGSRSLNNHSLSIEAEIDDKMRIVNDIKKLQAQILTSDKVAPMLQKFDKRETRVFEQTMSPISPIFQRATEVVQVKGNPLFDRMSKKMEQAKEYVRASEVRIGEEDVEQLRASRKSYSRQTLKKIQQELEQSQSEVFNDPIDQANEEYQVGRSSLFDNLIMNDDGANFAPLISDTPLIPIGKQQSSQEDELLFNIDSNKGVTPLGRQQSRSTLSKNEGAPMLPDDDESLSSDSIGEDFKNLAQVVPESQPIIYHHFDKDTYFAIKEEDDEEDSFEKEKRSKREQLQQEFEKKMDLIEKKLASNLFSDITQPTGNQLQRDCKTFVHKAQIPKFDTLFTQNQDDAFEQALDLLESRISLVQNNQDEDNLLLGDLDGLNKLSILQKLDSRKYSSVSQIMDVKVEIEDNSDLIQESIRRSQIEGKVNQCQYCQSREEEYERVKTQQNREIEKLKELLRLRDEEIAKLKQEQQ
ncbi:hypothetical protein FGO68_gene16360 [Halteria grandinella]|uniref:Kinesin motor domain-containing protein n=1 Tax=Halteria grandinella TaxID=5974 RepID=A0A8J8NZK2_HALGN|nr:hypothetical protein FGO68_gene16360 [Halteria grandinella]